MEIWLVYVPLGAFVGVLAGLFGVGGGLVIVPVLAVIFKQQGIPQDVILHLAIGTSLASIVLTSLSSVRVHHRHGAVLWQVVRALSPGIVAGALLGALVAEQLKSDALRIIFGVFELLVAAQIGFGIRAAAHRQLPGARGMLAAGGIVGMMSAIIGIGGGTLTVPFLVWCNATIRQAVATSSACGVPIAVAGTAGFVMTGWSVSLPPWSSGFVYWPAVAGVGAASLVFAPLGAKLAHTVSTTQLKRYFSLFLAVLGVRMLMLG